MPTPAPYPVSWTNPGCPNQADYTTFLYGIVQILPANLPSTSQAIPDTLSLAQTIVAEQLMLGGCPGQPVTSPTIYVLAVYNLGTDRLFNFAIDVPGQTFFADQRDKMKLHALSVGVASQASDQGTAVGILNPEQMKLFTLQDLQTLKTPWGRQYMAYAQMYGQSLWGLT